MALLSFNEWKLLSEGKKGKKSKTYSTTEPRMSDVETLKKTGRLSVEVEKGKVAKGHQPHLSGAGSHNSTPKRQRTRQGERRGWEKEVTESVDKLEKNTNLLYLSGLVTEEQIFETKSEVEDMLMVLNSHADNLGFKYPSGNKELTEKVKKMEQEGKIHYDDIYRKWKRGKGKKAR